MIMLALLLAAAVLARAQEPLGYGGSGPHGHYYYNGDGFVVFWFIAFFVGVFLLVACSYGVYTANARHTHVHGAYERLDADGKVIERVRYREDDYTVDSDAPVGRSSRVRPTTRLNYNI